MNEMHVTINVPKQYCTKPWNGENIRNGGVGVSGTDKSSVLVGEYYASKGNDVDIYSPSCELSIYRGVKYTTILNTSNTNILIVVPWIYSISSIICPKLEKLVIYFHCTQIVDSDGFLKFIELHKGIEVVGVYPSQWCKSVVDLKKYSFIGRHIIIPNPIMIDKFDEIFDTTNDRGLTFVNIASWERGGHVALRAFNIIDGISISIMDYYAPSHMPRKFVNKIKPIGSSDKNTVMKMLANSSYFIYPLVLPDSKVHKDTFACCVAEAIAMGTIVLTWPIAALVELYKPNHGVVFLEFPKNANITGLTSLEPISDKSLMSEEAVNIIVNTIRNIESDKQLKADIQRKGVEFSRNNYRSDIVCKMWDNV
jgi:glycosyltransferase involved in cell wall biosynthesis